MPFKSPCPLPAAAIALLAGLLNACQPSAAQESGLSPATAESYLETIKLRLAEEHIVNQPGTVSASLCSTTDEESLPGATFATCEILSIQSGSLRSRAYLFARGSRQLTIFHEGHHSPDKAGLADTLMPDARALLTELLQFSDVLYFDMPLLGVNSGEKLVIKGKEVSSKTHDRFALLDSPGHSALTCFLNPIDLALDSVAARYGTIKMVGRSGGGWATTLYAALDPRITESLSVAGTAPIVARSVDVDGRDDLGDWEQYGATIYRWLDYQDLYALAASGGRRHEQLYLEFDNCCFSGKKGEESRQIYMSAYGTHPEVRFTILTDAFDHYGMPVSLLAERMRD